MGSFSYPGTLCAVLLSGVLRLYSGICGAGAGRCFCKEQERSGQRIYTGSNRERCVSCAGGYLYWMDYMPDSFPKALVSVYPIVYNYSYLLAEGVITLIVISIPAVAKGLKRVRQTAV